MSVAFIATIALIGHVNIRSIAARCNLMYSQNTIAIEEMGLINTNLEKMRGDLYRYVAVPADRNKTAQSINEQIASVNDIILGYRSRDLKTEEKKILGELEVAWPEMQRGYKDAMKAVDDGRDDETANLMSATSYVVAARIKTITAVHELNEINRKNAEEANKSNISAASTASIVLLIATILSLVTGLTIGLMLHASVTKPLNKAMSDDSGTGQGASFRPA